MTAETALRSAVDRPDASPFKRALAFGLLAVPSAVYRWLIPRDVIGLCYHIVTDEWPAHVAHVCPFKATDAFRDDMQWLARNHELIGYEELRRRRESGARNRKPAFVVTFDDGFRECLTVAAPILRQVGIPAIFFVTTDFIDNKNLFYRNAVSLGIDALRRANLADQQTLLGDLSAIAATDFRSVADAEVWLLSLRRHDHAQLSQAISRCGIDPHRFLAESRPYLTTDEVLQLQSDGFTIGAHGESHVRLGNLEVDQLERELAGSCRTVADIVGRSAVPFAFPFSGHGLSIERLESLRARNPHVGLLFDGRGLLSGRSFVVHRISTDTPGDVASRSNLPELIHGSYQSQLWRQVRRPGIAISHVPQEAAGRNQPAASHSVGS